MSLSRRSFEFIFHHVILPPKLPQHDEDEDTEEEGQTSGQYQGRSLDRLVQETLKYFVNHRPQKIREAWQVLDSLLDNWIKCDKQGVVCKRTLTQALANLKSPGAIALHIRAQNCGWIAYHDKDSDQVIMDAFEASPRSEDVLSASGSLIRKFPGQSVAIPANMMGDANFYTELTNNITRLHAETVDIESVSKLTPTSSKAGIKVTEERESTHPGLVTEGLMSQLLVFGNHNTWPSFDKHMRDEVNWTNSRLPWRRSPRWFVLRVALQTVLQRILPDGEGYKEYKNFMLYLIATIGKKALSIRPIITSDQLEVIRMKIGRRAYKLRGDTFEFVANMALPTEEAIRTTLHSMQKDIMLSSSMTIPDSFTCSPNDLELSLSNSLKYLKTAMSGVPSDIARTRFDREHARRNPRDANGLPVLENGDPLSLADFENWIEHGLEPWSNTSPNSITMESRENLCCLMAKLLQTYSRFALSAYENCPEALSISILCMLELWVEIDKRCNVICSLLGKYSPEIPPGFLEPLLLPQHCQMRRAARIESYLQERHKRTLNDCPKIFSDPSSQSFAESYFDQSPEHKLLRQKIEEHAKRKRDDKKKEWAAKSTEHKELLNQVKKTSCEWSDKFGEEYHLPSCRRCSLERKAYSLRIELYEWPLPAGETDLKTVVFELSCPHWFVSWRDVTWKLVHDIGRLQSRKGQPMFQELLTYSELQKFGKNWGHRIVLGSTTKSWKNSHYSKRSFPVSLSEIIPPNALRFRLLDNKGDNAWITAQNEPSTVKPRCTLALPPGPYSCLKYAVDSFRHTENQVVADQQKCPRQMSLHEFISFGCLRAGERVQWHNMIRELASSTLSMNSEAVGILFRQAAWEFGTAAPNTELREAHQVLTNKEYGGRLLESMENKLTSVEANWNEYCTLQTLVALGLRVLSLSSDLSIVKRAIKFLRWSRKVGLRWCENLITTLHPKKWTHSLTQQLLLVRIGGVCQLTYAVEQQHLPLILESREDLFLLTRSSIIVFENTPLQLDNVPLEVKTSLILTSKVLHHLEEHTRLVIKQDGSGLNDSIRNSVPNLEIPPTWSICPGTLSRWVTNQTNPSAHGRRQDIHYNLLTGELLLENCPPGHLPRNYTNHKLYQRIFGAQTLTVLPSSLTGSEFMSTCHFGNYQVHFAIHAGELVVKAQAGNQILRLIPHDRLAGDFPESLVSDYAHWLNLENRTLEFRPLQGVWDPQQSNWHLSLGSAFVLPFMTQGNRKLVDIRCQLFESLASVLNVLDAPGNMHVVQAEEDSGNIIEVDMVRLRLKFFVNRNGDLECRELNAIVDKNQDIGCFYGLKNKLVFLDAYGGHRSVLIPHGNIDVVKHPRHPSISIRLPNESRVKYSYYSLDTHLHMLRGPTDMFGTLYQAYIHAVTSYLLPDPATGRTGTAEALRILRQAWLRSSFPLDEATDSILGHIAALTPSRMYYPSHLKRMQTIKWNRELGELSQHDDFRVLVRDIVEHASRFSSFHGLDDEESATMKFLEEQGDEHLLDRARFRHSNFRCSEFGGSKASPTPKPSDYVARDRDTQSERSCRVYEAAALIRSWSPFVPNCHELFQTIEKWEIVQPSRQARPPLENLGYNELLRLSFENSWCALYELCRLSERARDSYRLMSLFCTFAFGGWHGNLIYPLLAVAFSGQFRETSVPGAHNPDLVLNLKSGQRFVSWQIRDAVWNNYAPFATLMVARSIEERNRIKELRETYNRQKERDVKVCVTAIQQQWPCQNPLVPAKTHLNQRQASRECALLCTQWYSNMEFLGFVQSVQDRLDTIMEKAKLPENLRLHAPCPPSRSMQHTDRCFVGPTLLNVLRSSKCPTSPADPKPLKFVRNRGPPSFDTASNSELSSLILSLCDSKNTYQRQLGEGLEQSLEALRKFDLPSSPSSFPLSRKDLFKHRDNFQNKHTARLNKIITSLTASEGFWEIVAGRVVGPQITSCSLLAFLTVDQWRQVPKVWKPTLLQFALGIACLRRYDRLLACVDRNDIDGFYKEGENVSGENWEPSTQPEWLLFEIENNLTIRGNQTEVAQRMILPELPGNSVLQLNMGEGKTSVITPMIASSLANSTHLLRLFVLKPLLRQSVNLLSQRLGGMLNRRVYHIPFSRDTPLDMAMVNKLQQIYTECQEKRGVLIVLPEQVLSYRLVCLDMMIRNPPLAHAALEVEKWLQSSCRNVIDESDEVLDPKFQLVYTVGSQQVMDGHSDRWEVTQALLGLVERQAEELHLHDPTYVDIERSGTRYPIFHFLRAETVDLIIQKVLDAIRDEGLPGIPFNQWTPQVRWNTMDFIRAMNLPEEDYRVLRSTFEGSLFVRKLLVLRGLLAFGVLKFSLGGKSWLVDYGLHPSRCLMAVPFRAKGIPSDNAEFGHPDVAVTLTCLSYYYQGLNEEQVRHCFELLKKENDPSSEYKNWISRHLDALPVTLQAISGVNLEDVRTFSEVLYPHLQYQKGMVDFYLSRVVFPKEAKDFPDKLSTSAWDLPSRPHQPLTTGFSGTNDNRLLLPRSIPQRDLPHLMHTNAMVLSYLVRVENRECVLAHDKSGKQLSAHQLITLINKQTPRVRVIIDVGAQILELSNHDVAKQWLHVTSEDDSEAAIFYDQNHEAIVLDREGHLERLWASSFRERMHKCLVFLDQQHARGVDLKLPSTYRAAVTLGPRLAKDRLVQACNRMRGLGNGQSVMFFIPPEVSHSMELGDNLVTSLDVIRWSLKQTCEMFESLAPLWASQGLHYHKRMMLWDRLINENGSPEKIVLDMQEPESQTFSQLYAPWEKPRISNLEGYVDQSDQVIRDLKETLFSGKADTTIYRLHEEQERQVAHEVEREEQICRPPPLSPLPHKVHDDIRYFVVNGCFPDQTSRAVRFAFQIFSGTSVGRAVLPERLCPELYVTEDFAQSVKLVRGVLNDEFLKPVHWVLSNVYNTTLILLSQFEANELLPIIVSSQKVKLHVYAPRTAKAMRSFNDLSFLTAGEGQTGQQHLQLRLALDLFAGSLYFDSFALYDKFRGFLGLVMSGCGEIPEGRVSNEGFVDKKTRKEVGWPVHSPFRSNPLPFLNALFNIRSKGHGYLQTHVGRILEMKSLTEDDF